VAPVTPRSSPVLGFTQLCFGILGALAISGEYSTGTIRASLAAVPNRLRFLTAKIIVLGAVALLLGEAVTFAMFVSGQAMLRSAGAPHTGLAGPGVLRTLVATGVFLGLLSLLGLGCGAIFRRSAGAIAAYVVLTFVSVFVTAFSGTQLGKYTPLIMLLNSASAVRSNAVGGFLPPGWVSVAVMSGYAAAALVAGAVLFTRRDA
jgi:ABC-2 type transport system permease protein